MRAAFVVILAVASLLTVLVSAWWSLAGVIAKWRRDALRLPSLDRLTSRAAHVPQQRQ